MSNTATIGTISVTNFGCSANGTFTGSCTSTGGFYGSLTGIVYGNATSSTYASTLTTIPDTTNGAYYLIFSKNSAVNTSIYINNSSNIITYNPSTGNLVCPSITSNITGNLTGAASQVSVNLVSSNTNYNIMMTTSTTGNVAIDDTSTLLYNPSSQILTTGGIAYSTTITNLGSNWLSANFQSASSILNYSGQITATTNYLSFNNGRVGAKYTILLNSTGAFVITNTSSNYKTNLLTGITVVNGTIIQLNITYDGTYYYCIFQVLS